MKSLKFFGILLCLLVLNNEGYSQHIYAVYFKDKNLSPYSTQNPEAYLSTRAIQRRQQQEVAITSEDFPVNPSYVNTLIASGAKLRYTSKWLNLAVLEFENDTQAYFNQNLPFVKEIRKIGLRSGNKTTKKASQSKPVFLKPLKLFSSKKKTNDDFIIQLQQIGIDQLHQAGYTGKGTLIAVFDAGFLATSKISAYETLRNRSGILSTKDFVDIDTSVYDMGSHGTQVLSCIAAIHNGMNLGTAPGANFILCRTEDGNSETIIEEYNWLAAAEYADSMGVDIINSSLGYTTFDIDTQSHSYQSLDGKTAIVTRAAEIATSKGIIVVNSAGNEGNKEWNYISCPSDAQHVVTVGAIDENEYYVSFSGKGPTYDNRLKPNILARGRGAYVYSPDGNLIQLNGTSFSSPIIAGAFASLIEANKGKLKYKELIELVYQSSSNYNAPNYEVGYGIPNFSTVANVLLGVEDTHIQPIKVVISPNPFSQNLNIEVNSYIDNKSCYIGLFDEMGRLVAKQKRTLNKGKNAIILENLSNLSKGVYTVFIETEKQSFAYQVLKQ